MQRDVGLIAPRRSTAASIRKATPFPKPRGAIEKEMDYRGGGSDQVINLDGRHLLAHIVDHADALDVTTDGGTRWLLVPMPPKLMHLLEWLGAGGEDIEDGNDTEDDGISGEASLGASDDTDQEQWGAGSYEHDPDLEEKRAGRSGRQRRAFGRMVSLGAGLATMALPVERDDHDAA